MMQIILASQSPRRKQLLEQIGLTFTIHPSTIEENSSIEDPELLVEELSLHKALDVAQHYPDSLVIGADTVVVQDDSIIGKPNDEQHAVELLNQLSDTDHMVFTGVAVVLTDKNGNLKAKRTFHEQTKVIFSALSNEDMEAYVNSGSPMDKAGAYGIQDDTGALFVERIEGDYYNVVGFPLNRFYREMKTFLPDFTLIPSKR